MIHHLAPVPRPRRRLNQAQVLVLVPVQRPAQARLLRPRAIPARSPTPQTVPAKTMDAEGWIGHAVARMEAMVLTTYTSYRITVVPQINIMWAIAVSA